MDDERDLHALGEALAADLGGLGGLGGALFAGLVGSPAAPDHWPGRAGGWSDDDPANVDDDVPFVDTRPDRGKLTLGGVLADSHARHARSREDAIAEVLNRWRDGEDLDAVEQVRVDNLLAVAPDGWSMILAERNRIRRRARIRARREHTVGLHCAGCHPWHD